ncbi:MAG: hypothetical protein COS99_01070 [Candidatus Omnitrophica bacterium CG07_land_8_20_14_0_80_42_15]|uniref:Glycosyltransferase subfamily 4-like N-terminal domain-containing protein n=1 Tax=Candidatus Aquitaenariimonas noxiae TaxID=1974741 RepID=A0A2J0KUZ5_9BACT|nr:MAG: hypothetical protein COS99_01070 [Candidatus Omnitrophica bacterium CG07_land_8_20_14_0_80_42_15]
MKKVLVISYYFPPFRNTSWILRVAKFVKYLPSFNWNPIVFTAKTIYSKSKDFYFFNDVPKSIKIYRFLDFDPAALIPPWISFKIRQTIKTSEYHKLFWTPFAVSHGCDIIDKEGIDIIYATGKPYVNFIVASKIKDITGLPIVLDFRDPWSLNPYEIRNCAKYRVKAGVIEEKILRKADFMICTSSLTKEKYLNLYGFLKDKIEVIPNGYDDEDFINAWKQNDKFYSKKMLITYTGSFYMSRTPSYFLKGLSAMLKENPEISKHILVRFIGEVELRSFDRLIKELELESIVCHMGLIPHRKCIEEIIKSDVLLLITSSLRDEEMFISSKAYEYIASGKTILALVPLQSELASLTKECGAGIVVQPDDIVEIKMALLSIYQKWKSGNMTACNNLETTKQFQRKELTGKLSQIFNNLLNK